MKRNNQTRVNEALDLMNSEVGSIFVEELQESIEKTIEKTRGYESGAVETAVLLDKSEKVRVENLLTNILKRHIKVKYSVKPSLLGGIKITVGDWRVDGTLQHQIEKMRENIGGRNL